MPQFTYKAKDSKGEPIQGTMEAESHTVVTNRLQSMGLFPITVNAEKDKSKKGSLGELMGRPVRMRDITAMNRQLADLLSAGISLVKALGIMVNQTPNERLREILTKVSNDVQGGDTLAAAMSKHPKVFSKLYCAMIRAGETGGMLDTILQRLADFSETEEDIRSKIKSALAYPVVMIIASIGALIILMTVVIPKLLKVFESLNQALPLPTQILIDAVNFFGARWYFILGGAVLAAGLAVKFVKTDEGRIYWHRMLLKMPLIGHLIQKQQIGRFARILGSLLNNGVSILNSLEITKEVIGNEIVKQEVAGISDNITQGSGVAAPLKGSEVFPPVVVNMIAIGEETGRLNEVLLRIASSYEIEVDRSIKTLTSLIEPIIILVMGTIVGFVVISILLPIFNMDPTGGGGF